MTESNAQTRNEIFTELRKHYGAMKKLAERHGCSVSWVKRVFNGDHDDPELILKASELLIEIIEERAKTLSAISANFQKVKQLSVA